MKNVLTISFISEHDALVSAAPRIVHCVASGIGLPWSVFLFLTFKLLKIGSVCKVKDSTLILSLYTSQCFIARICSYHFRPLVLQGCVQWVREYIPFKKCVCHLSLSDVTDRGMGRLSALSLRVLIIEGLTAANDRYNIISLSLSRSLSLSLTSLSLSLSL